MLNSRFFKYTLFQIILGNYGLDHEELISSAFFILWGKCFIYQWKQKEKLYNYIWGTENYQKAQLDQESFVPDGYIPLLMGHKAPYVNKFKKYFRIFVSYIFIFFMMCIVFCLVTIIFRIKGLLIQKFPDRTTEIGILIGFVNTIQINLMSGFYQGIAKHFNDKENHRKETDANSALAIKLIIYDFFNPLTHFYKEAISLFKLY